MVLSHLNIHTEILPFKLVTCSSSSMFNKKLAQHVASQPLALYSNIYLQEYIHMAVLYTTCHFGKRFCKSSGMS